ncbi:MAG: TVP38/TMEM64 family protein [Clostridia bacterium]|nr:TVP38/TMEM64 family protein [Clostridia bacterium]
MRADIRRRLCCGLLLLGFFLTIFVLTLVFWDRLVALVSDPVAFEALMQETGFGGRLIFVALMAAQVVLAIIPGHPFEIAGGYCFGALEGTLLTLLGAAIGSAAAFLLSRLLGAKAVSAFYSEEKIQKAAFLRAKERQSILTFIAFLIPGLPKDMLAYLLGLTKMRFGTFLLISTVGRFPGILIAVLGGAAVQSGSIATAVIFSVVVLITLVICFLLYRKHKIST